MKAITVIQELQKHQILLQESDGKLLVDSPKGALTDEFRNLIRSNKEKIIDFLKEQTSFQSSITKPQQIKKRIPSFKSQCQLSFAQQRLWFIDQLQEGSAEYNMPAAFRIEGNFDIDAAEQAVVRIISRHESLRTVFNTHDENTLQIIQTEFEFELTRHDLTSLNEQAQQAKVKTLMREDRLKSFDLGQDLMVRVAYLHLSTKAKPNQDILLFNMHHIASDGWSMGILLNEFVTQYQSVIQKESDPLAPLAIQYADYSLWQRQWLVGEVLDAQLDYWTHQLDSVPAVHSLPLDYPRPVMQAHQGAVVICRLDFDVSMRLQQIAREHQLTPFMLLHAGLSLVLSRHSHSHDIVVGTPMANRMLLELEPLIGFFVNTLVLRANTSHETLADYLAHIRTINIDAQTHQDIPFEQLVEHCQVPRSTQHTPLFQIMFTMDTNEQSELNIPGVNFYPLSGSEVVSQFDLDISAQISEKGIDFTWVYDTSLFTHEHIETFSTHLNRLLIGIAEAPDAKLCDLPMLSPQETHYLLHELNDTQFDYPQDKLIHELFEAQVVKHPSSVAVVFEDKQLSYQELNEASNQLARYMKENHDIQAETLVGLCIERSIDMVIAILAIYKAGGAYVPLVPSLPKARLQHLIKETEIKVVISDENSSLKLSDIKIDTIELDNSTFIAVIEKHSTANLARDLVGVSERNLAYIIYTSGSTGSPKGVMIEHMACLNHCYGMIAKMSLNSGCSIAQTAPISFDISVWQTITMLLVGGQTVIIKDETVKSPRDLIEELNSKKVTLLQIVPSLLSLVLDECEGKKLQFSSLKCCSVTGEACPINLQQRWGKIFKDIPLINAYGPAECADDVLLYFNREILSEHIDSFLRLESEVRGYCRDYPSLFEKAVGSELFDSSGKRYLDLFCGAGALNYGHNNKLLKSSLIEYINQDGITHSLDLFTVAKAKFLEAFERYILQPRALNYKVMFPGPTGTNAVEAALKLARKVTGRQWIVYCENSFHGMTMASLSVSAYKNRAGIPLSYTQEIEFISEHEERPSITLFQQQIESLEELPAAIILEIVQAEGGINVANRQWLKCLFDYAKQKKILVIVDDIQAGCGRTGHFFSFEHFDVKPDLICLSKSISGYGLPMSLVLIRPDLDLWEPAEHSGTFRGNNHAFITGAKAIELYWSDADFEQQIQTKADHLKRGLQTLLVKYPKLNGKHKGLGLIQGIECTPPSLATEIKLKAFECNLIMETAGKNNEVLKFLPALTMTVDQLNESLTTIDSVIGNILDPSSMLVKPVTMPVGKPIGNLRVYIVDDNNTLVPYGVTGELLVAGDGLARGYFNKPQMTDNKFVELLFGNFKEKVYKTGDLVRYLPEGNIEFIGRMDDQVKIRGFRIELGEIESQLLKITSVAACLVLAREDDPGQKRLVAYLVAKESTEGDDVSFVATLREELQRILPDYMVPSAFILLDKFPLTPNGKVDKNSLPKPDRCSLIGEYVAPETETEHTLIKIWAKLLRLEDKAVSVTANFFELGGDSILSVQVVSCAAQQGLFFSIKDLFDAQTIKQLALVAKIVNQVNAPQGEVSGDFSLLPIQRQFFNDETDLHHFNQAVMLTTPKGFSIDALTDIIQTLVTHHDGLRLCFQRVADQWQARHQAFTDSLLTKLVTVKQWPDSTFDDIADYATQIQQSLKPEEGVLLKAVYIQPKSSADAEGRLLLVIHHLVVDGVSWRILLEDFEHLYGQWLSQSTLTLPAKTSSFQQWGAFLSRYSQSEALQQEQAYWLQSFATPVKRLNALSVNQGTDPSDSGMGLAHFKLTATQTEQLLSQCQGTYRTQINELLLAGLLYGYHQWSGERALRIDLEGHGREALSDSLDLSRTVGWFTSVYPLTLSLSDDDSLAGDELAAVICAVKEQYRAIPNNGIGFGILTALSGLGEFEQLPASELEFNYLGQFDQVVNAETYLQVASESSGQSESSVRKEEHSLSLNGMVGGGCLSFSLSFDKAQYQGTAMQALMDAFAGALKALIAHCVDTPWGRYSPSDFPLARVNAQELAEWQIEADEQVEDLYPTTGMQQGLLFHSLLERGSYVAQTLLTFDDLAIERFQQAWRQVVARHVIFRTAFVGLDIGNAHQVVYREVELLWRFEDLSALDKPSQAEQVESIRLADKLADFEVTQAPLMRMTVLKLSADTHELIWSHHHALLDGWCISLVFAEVVACYQALCRGELAQLGPVSSYRGYAAWLGEQKLDKAEAFWAEQLSQVEESTALPLMAHQEEKGTDLSGIYQQGLSLNVEQSNQLQALAQSSKTTVNVIVQAAWGLLLSRYSGEAQVVFGATTSGRPPHLAGVEEMVGLFINTLPVVMQVEADLSVESWLQKIHQQLVEREVYNYLPLNDIQRMAPMNQSLFDSLLVFDNYPVDEAIEESVAEAELKVSGVQSFESTNYGLSVIAHLEQSLSIEIEAQKKLFTEAALSQITTHLKQLLLNLAGSIQRKGMQVGDIDMLSEQETHYLLHGLNDTYVDYPKDKLIHELFEAQAEEHPNNIALVFEDKQMTYQALNESSNRLAHYLRDQGVEAETLVGIYLERSIEMVVGILGILKAGGAYVPLDPNYPQARLEYILKETDVKYLLTQSGLKTILAFDESVDVIELDTVFSQDKLSAYSSRNLEQLNKQNSSNLAYVIYTSGSTGKPKGVMVEHRALFNRIDWMQNTYRLDVTDRVLQKTPYSFDVSVWEFLWTLGYGARLVIAKPDGHKDPEYLNALILQQQVTVVHFVPSMLNAYLVTPLIEFPESLRYVFCSGEALEVADVKAMQTRASHVALHNLYGPTEAAIDVSYFDCGALKEGRNIPIGKPIQNIELFVLNRSLHPCPMGVQGELHIGGAGLARGYLNQPELTAERFIQNPFSDDPNARLYRTGDLVHYLPDGNLEFLGRMDDQVKIRGFRIELGEIESQLSQCESVASVLVLAREDEPGEKRLVAYVVAKADEFIDETAFVTELRDNLQHQLPDYMMPSAFIILAAFPLTSNGKVDKKALPLPDGTLLQGEYIAPESESEKALVEIWAKLLKLDAETISVTGNFFELGGHSLLAIRLVADIRAQLQQELAIKVIFESSTIRALAERIDSGFNAPLRIAVMPFERQPDEPVITSFAQQRLWFIDQLQQGSAEYNIPSALQIEGDFDVDAAEQAIIRIVERHESLRTIFKVEDNDTFQTNTLQIIQSEFDFKLSRYDLTELDEVEQQAKVKVLMHEDSVRAFDLSQDLMVRASYLHLSKKNQKGSDILLFNMHHIASDGWSMGILLNEFVTQYQSIIQGETDPLPPLEIQYADYAQWQREWLAGEVLEGQLEYWTQQLEDVPAEHSLPLDYPRPETATYQGAMVSSQLDADLSQRLQQIAQEHQLTPFMLLHAGLALVLSRHSNSQDIVIGTPMANRMQVELEPLIGFFINTLVLRANTNHETLSDYLAHIRTINLDAQTHQDIPFEQLVEHCNVQRSTQHSPLFQIMFSMDTNQIQELTLPGLNFSPINNDKVVAKFDLTISAQVTDEGIQFSWIYDKALFTHQKVESLNDHLQAILTNISNKPSAPLGELSMLSVAEVNKLVYELNDTKVDYPKNAQIHELFEEQVKRVPENIALVDESKRLTYRELDHTANKLAHHLRTLGVKNGSTVGLYLNRSVDMLVGLLAILKAGGAYVPFDPFFGSARLDYGIQDANINVLLTETQQFQGVKPEVKHIVCIDEPQLIEVLQSYSPLKPIITEGCSAQDLAYIIYTSGSTGNPKGVEITHRGLVDYCYWGINNYYDPELAGAKIISSVGFDGTVTSIYFPLLVGGYVELSAPGTALDSFWLSLLKSKQRLFIKITPSHIQGIALMSEELISDCEHTFVIGGELLTKNTLESLQSYFPSANYYHHYGPTETVVGSTLLNINSYQKQQNNVMTQQTQEGFPIGKPMGNAEVYILDSNSQLQPFGVPGELCIGGDGLARGYLNLNSLTSERFISNPFSNNLVDRIYRTGDLVRYLADGNIEFIGRIDNQVKIRGFRIELGEIEQKLSQLPQVSSAVVIVQEDDRDQKRLVAYVVCDNFFSGDTDEILKIKYDQIKSYKTHLKSQLPEYMVPEVYVFLEELPLTSNGKLDRKSLPMPEESDLQRNQYVAPRNETEHTLCEIWQQVIGLKQVGVQDNFFSLGGHSLLATRLISMVRQQFNIEIPLKMIFENPTVEKFASIFESYADALVISSIPKIEKVKPVNVDNMEEGEF